MTRCLMICSQYPPVYGGAGGQAALLSRALTARGVHVEVATLNQSKIGSRLEHSPRIYRWWKHPARGPVSNLMATASLSVLACLRIAVFRPDVVHVHGIYWWTILPVLLAKALGRVSVIKSTRDGEDDPHTVVTRKFGRLPMGWLYGLSVRVADAIIVLNDGAAFASAKRAGVAGKSHLVKNGVDSERYRRTAQRRREARQKFNLNDGVQVVLFAGYLAPHKGVPELLDAWRALSPENAELWLVGPHTGFYRELVESTPERIEAVKRAGLHIRTFGHVSSEDMNSFYWAADVFCLPSHAEGMPNSLAEAIVAGCQVVATEIPGIVDIVTPESARLVEVGNVGDLRSALEASLSSAPLDTTEIASALSISQVADKYANLYQTLIAQKRTSRNSD